MLSYEHKHRLLGLPDRRHPTSDQVCPAELTTPNYRTTSRASSSRRKPIAPQWVRQWGFCVSPTKKRQDSCRSHSSFVQYPLGQVVVCRGSDPAAVSQQIPALWADPRPTAAAAVSLLTLLSGTPTLLMDTLDSSKCQNSECCCQAEPLG